MEVEVKDGEVILRGTVDSFWKKYYAEDIVALEPGVIIITNHLAVVPGGDIVDEEIADDVVRSLEARADVSADDVEVQVQDGVVELTGTVPHWTARQSAYEAAAYSAGVVDVDDRLLISSARYR